jgi:hypothetical protein
MGGKVHGVGSSALSGVLLTQPKSS